MINLIDYIDHKKKIVEMKIKTKQNKLKKINQTGGALKEQITGLQNEIMKLMAMNTILSNQKNKVETLNLQEMLDTLSCVTNKLKRIHISHNVII
jgi:hypothetical protein